MSTSNNVMLTLTYEDATTRNITFKDVAQENFDAIAEKVRNINANMSTNFKNTFVSNDGAAVMKIGKAQIITIEEEVIYND